MRTEQSGTAARMQCGLPGWTPRHWPTISSCRCLSTHSPSLSRKRPQPATCAQAGTLRLSWAHSAGSPACKSCRSLKMPTAVPRGCSRLPADFTWQAAANLTLQPAEAGAHSQSLGRRCAAASHILAGSTWLIQTRLHKNLWGNGRALWALHAPGMLRASCSQLTQTGWRGLRGQSVRSTFHTRRLQSSLQVATVLGSLAHQAAPVTSLECPSSR